MYKNYFPSRDGKGGRFEISVHPVTGELFFCVRNETYAFFPGKTSPRLVIDKGEVLEWSPDGRSLFLIDRKAVWRLSGPGIDSVPVSTAGP